MKVVIMAAGRGTRLGELTQSSPKALVKVCGKPILRYTLECLPSSVTDVIFVIGYCGHRIQEMFGDHFGSMCLRYVTQTQLTGTADALWAARNFLNNSDEHFLVLNGDDIYTTAELEHCLAYEQSLGLYRTLPRGVNYGAIEIDGTHHITGSRELTEADMHSPILIATGAYVLTKKIFDYERVRLANGEYGLPHTVFSMAKDIPVKGVFMDSWLQINYPEDIVKAEGVLSQKDR